MRAVLLQSCQPAIGSHCCALRRLSKDQSRNRRHSYSLARACRASLSQAEVSYIKDMSDVDTLPHGMFSCSAAHKRMEATIARLGNITLGPAEPSRFVRPGAIYYELDGQVRRWDVVDAHDSIGVILYHKDLQSMLLVRQFRLALYASLLRKTQAESKEPPKLHEGFTCELCAGLVDKDKSLELIVQEEIHEECGFNVPLDAIKKITAFPANVGIQGSTQHLFFAIVDNSMQENDGGGVAADGEAIELLALPLANVEAFVLDASIPKTAAAMFGLTWAKQQVQ